MINTIKINENNANTEVPIINNETDIEKNRIYEWCIFSFAVIFALGLMGSILTYIIFAIMYLVQDYDIANDCEGSSLWEYVLTAIVLSFCRSNAKHDNKKEPNICVFILLGLIECGLAIWGGIELWEKSCSYLSDTNLWQIGLVTFILQVSCAAIFLIIAPLVTCCFVYKDSTEMHRSLPSDNIV